MIGIDIQDASRMEGIVGTEKMNRIFSRRELDYLSKKNFSLETVTGMFCAKEAFFKAVGSGINISKLVEVEVWHHKSGAPFYVLSPEIVRQNNLSTSRVDLSISHTNNVAAAVCHIARGVMR